MFGPSMWVRHQFRRHGADRPDFPGTGGELARHLLDQAGLSAVRVEPTDHGDHYDPEAKAVHLTRPVLEGRSITAVAVAAHEVGHALQDRDGYAALRYRTKILGTARLIQKIGLGVMLLGPVVAALARTPVAALVPLIAGWLVRLSAVVAALAALPSEFDASFGRALPILREGNYIAEADLSAARAVLKAAALTYVANAALQALFAGRGGMRF